MSSSPEVETAARGRSSMERLLNSVAPRKGDYSRQKPISIEGVTLVRDGDDAVVLVVINGKEVEVIREHVYGEFSHHVHVSGVIKRLEATP